jgi:hypothetical protein
MIVPSPASLGPQPIAVRDSPLLNPFFLTRASSSHPYLSKKFSRPLFSYSYALFCVASYRISLLFNRFRTLRAKQPGWGMPRNRKRTYNAQPLPTFSTSSTRSTRVSTRNPLCFHTTTHDFRHHGGVQGVFTSFAAISLLCHNHRACRATEPGYLRPARNLLKP